MSSYTIPTEWTTEDLIEALLPPESITTLLDSNTLNYAITAGGREWMARVETIRHSPQAKPEQPELLHVAERKAY